MAVRSAVVRVGFAGVSQELVQDHGEAFAEALPALLRPEAMARIRWHQDHGDTVAVVSGGLDAYLAPWCRAHGLELVCSVLEQRGDGRFTGRYLGAQCVGEEKARRVRQRYDLSAYGCVYAYGDTREDLALLALAHHRFYRGRELADAQLRQEAART